MRRLMLAFALALSLLAPAIQSQATACAFQLGFATVHDLAPTQVGDCVEDEGHNPENGDGLQHTTNGLMVWRKTDNWTAFTNGYRTWINGPNSLRYRLNEERFSWESDAANHATVADWEVVTLTRPGWGFSVRYPSSWRRDDSAPTISILYSHPPHEYRFGRAPGESQIDVGIFSRYGSKVGILSAEDKVRGYPVGMPPSYGLCGTVLFSKVVVVANQKAARIDFEFCHSLAIYSGDHVISFEGFGDLLPFDVVASSVRLQ